MSSVKMWLALDEFDNAIKIDEAEPKKEYRCISCNRIVKPRAKESNIVSEHYYHVESCECNGESAIHKYWKENFMNIGEEINIPTIGKIKCIDKRIEHELNIGDGDTYRPDLILKTDSSDYKYIIVEIYNTNSKRYDEYISKWKKLNYCIIEVDVKSLKKDKSNLNKNIKVLYDKKKEYFYKNCEYELKKMYSSLSIFKSADLHKAFSGYYGRRDYEGSIERAEKLLSRVYKIIKGGCYNKSKVNLNLITSSIKNEKWDYTVNKSIVQPLSEIVDILHIYK